MIIQRIYDKYKIMPQLQLHMLRVAGVASIICDNFRKDIDKETVVTACLVHDIGNIIKSNLDFNKEELATKGISYWQEVKNEYTRKYGNNADKANYKIGKELKLPKRILSMYNKVGISKLKDIYSSKEYELKLYEYSDLRVVPSGVVSLRERIDEGFQRYSKEAQKKNYNKQSIISLLEKIEEQIFFHTDLKPEDITDRKVMPLILKLKNFDIKTL